MRFCSRLLLLPSRLPAGTAGTAPYLRHLHFSVQHPSPSGFTATPRSSPIFTSTHFGSESVLITPTITFRLYLRCWKSEYSHPVFHIIISKLHTTSPLKRQKDMSISQKGGIVYTPGSFAATLVFLDCETSRASAATSSIPKTTSR